MPRARTWFQHPLWMRQGLEELTATQNDDTLADVFMSQAWGAWHVLDAADAALADLEAALRAPDALVTPIDMKGADDAANG